MSRTQISEINAAVLDLLGMADMGDRLSAVTVTLHRTTWPTARLEVILDQAKGRTERQFVRLVPEGAETGPQPTWIEKACAEAMERVQAAIDRSSSNAKLCLSLGSLPSLMKIPTFRAVWHMRTGMGYSCANEAAQSAFERFEAAMFELELVTHPSPFLGRGVAALLLKDLK